MGSVYKRGETYWIKYRDANEILRRESSESSDKVTAKELLLERELAAAKGRNVDMKAKKTTFEALTLLIINDYKINEYRSLGRLKRSLSHLSKYFGKKLARNISTDVINAYIIIRKDEGAAKATINRELSALKRMFNIACKECTPPKVYFVPSIKMLDETDNVRIGFFEFEPFFKVKEALPNHLKGPFVLAHRTGMRMEEILSLKWDDDDVKVNIFERKIELGPKSVKNKEPRAVFLQGETYEVIKRQKAIRDMYYPSCEYVFFNLQTGERIKDFRFVWERTLFKALGIVARYTCTSCKTIIRPQTPLTKKQRKNLVCSECNETKFKKSNAKIFHDLRRTAVRNAIKAGVPEKVVMEMSGHKTRSVLDRYNIICEEEQKDAAKKISERNKEMEEQYREMMNETISIPFVNQK